MKIVSKFIKWFFEIKPTAPEEPEKDAFQIECDRRKEKHKRTLHPSATGCRVHLPWDDRQEAELIKHLNGGSTLFELSGLTGRPIWGIANRLKKLGLVCSSQGRQYYINKRLDRVPLRIERTLSPLVLKTLIEKGWYYEQRIDSKGTKIKKLMSPSWWVSNKFLDKGCPDKF